MHADTQWYRWAPKEKLGIFNFTEDKGDCFLSSAVALRKQNKPEEKHRLWKKKILTGAEEDETGGKEFCFMK